MSISKWSSEGTFSICLLLQRRKLKTSVKLLKSSWMSTLRWLKKTCYLRISCRSIQWEVVGVQYFINYLISLQQKSWIHSLKLRICKSSFLFTGHVWWTSLMQILYIKSQDITKISLIHLVHGSACCFCKSIKSNFIPMVKQVLAEILFPHLWLLKEV